MIPYYVKDFIIIYDWSSTTKMSMDVIMGTCGIWVAPGDNSSPEKHVCFVLTCKLYETIDINIKLYEPLSWNNEKNNVKCNKNSQMNKIQIEEIRNLCT